MAAVVVSAPVAAVVVASASRGSSPVAAALTTSLFELLVLLFDLAEEVFAEFAGVLDFVRIGACNMEVHGFVAFLPRICLEEAGPTTFDLDSTAGLGLDVFDVGAAVADHLGAQVEAGDGLEVDGDAFFGPFALGGS